MSATGRNGREPSHVSTYLSALRKAIAACTETDEVSGLGVEHWLKLVREQLGGRAFTPRAAVTIAARLYMAASKLPGELGAPRLRDMREQALLPNVKDELEGTVESRH